MIMSKKYEAHPYADIFPMMSKSEIEALAEDIKDNGIQRFGCLYQGKILDGRSRYAACQIAGVEMSWEDADMMERPEEFDAMAYVLSTNLHRRQLKQSQRAMIGAKMARLKDGQRPSQNCEPTRVDAAKLLSVSPRSIDSAKYVLEHGCQQLVEAVESCEVTASLAEKLCKETPDKREQAKLVKQGKEAIKAVVSPVVEQHESEVIERDDEDFIFEAFNSSPNRLATIRKIIEVLQPHELAVVKEMIASPS